MFLAAAAAAMLATACGAYSYPGTVTSPSPHGGSSYDVTATNTDHSVTMRVGQRLEVVLHAADGMSNWARPRSNDESVLRPVVDPAATAVIGVTLAAFQAGRAGQVEVTSYASPKCSPGQPCPMFVAAYSLKVTVTP